MLLGLALACAPEAATPPAPEEGSAPWVVLSVHLEGMQLEHGLHVEEVRELLAEADEAGVPLSLEPSPEFLAAEVAFGSPLLREAQAAGHDVALHANVYEHEASFREAEDHLQDLLRDLRTLGVTPSAHGSGLCSRQDWVGLAAEADLTAASGIVAYCLRSLPEVPEGYEAYAECEDPAACHERVPLSLADRLYPWRAGSGSAWLEPSDTGVWLFPAAVNYPCAAEFEVDPAAESCPISGEDIPAVARALEAAIADRSRDGVKVFSISWSLGSTTSRRQMGAFFAMIQARVNDGRARWGTPSEVTAALGE